MVTDWIVRSHLFLYVHDFVAVADRAVVRKLGGHYE